MRTKSERRDVGDMARDESAADGHMVAETWVDADGSRWRVGLQLTSARCHRMFIERDGHLAVEHVGSVPADWPGDAFPQDVRMAVQTICERMSWS